VIHHTNGRVVLPPPKQLICLVTPPSGGSLSDKRLESWS
jgi:hypothetical protein